jgi:PBP1b-binding outer membrane lipoprotein LpoB
MESMKKLVLIVLAGLFLGACAQKTCPTYTYNDLDSKEFTVENKI